MKKIFIVFITFLLVASNALPFLVSVAHADNITNTNNTDINFTKKENSNGNFTNGDDNQTVNVNVNTNVTTQAIVNINHGSYAKLSAYQLQSIQGKSFSTFIPNLDYLLEREDLNEYKSSSLTETTYFSDQYLRDHVFNQDGNFSLEYVEALNWLYKNNYIHLMENLSIKTTSQGGTWNGDEFDSVSSQSGSQSVSRSYEVSSGALQIEFNAFNSNDKISVLNKNGKVLLEKTVTGFSNLYLNISENQLITIKINDGKVLEGSNWEYRLISPHSTIYKPKRTSDVTVDEISGKGANLYPLSEGQKSKDIKRKDLIMQLMKVVDGLEYSRPILVESAYEYIDSVGKVNIQTSNMGLMNSKFRSDAWKLGLDIGVNDVDVDFNKYGMHKVYVNPNVYELYLRKAYNSGIINKSEIKDTSLLKYVDVVKGTSKNTTLARWDNNLPYFRANTVQQYNNNGEFTTDSKTRVFGSSWTDITKDNSSTILNGSFLYDKDYEYFYNEDVSYIDAVIYAYRAINAYSDEKLPQREVDTIMSMYSVNYGKLNENEKLALNYLIAKGIIDGDNSARFTSTDNISVEDALVLIYRIANPSARLTFKTQFGNIDEAMLSRGYTQSKIKLNEYSEEVPTVQYYSESNDSYYIITNSIVNNKNYRVATGKYTFLDKNNYSENVTEVTSDELRNLGIIIEEGKYNIWRVDIPWTSDLVRLGLSAINPQNEIVDWINLELGGGYYYIREETVKESKSEELSMLRVVRNSNTLGVGGSNLDDMSYNYDHSFYYEEEPKREIDFDYGGNNTGNTGNNDSGNKDPKGILNFSNFNLFTFQKYYTDGAKTLSVFIGMNEAALNDLTLDGKKLMLNGKLNEKLVTTFDGIDNIKLVSKVPDKAQVTWNSSSLDKVFLEFVFPSTGQRTVSELTSLIQRRLALGARSELVGDTATAYTSSANGQTLISQKELKRFGITTSPEEPDILFHEKTGTYAYLNNEKDYALISNTIIKFPQNSLMISISADEIFYNVEVIMSMLNSDDFYLFNKEGKYEIVRKLADLTERNIYNPSTGGIADTTYTASIYRYAQDGRTPKLAGTYLNITSISGGSNTFFLTSDKTKNSDKFIYSFEPYYVKTQPARTGGGVKADSVVSDLSRKVADVTHVENLLINNSIMRQQLNLPKSSTLLNTDNAIKVTQLSQKADASTIAEQYFEFIKNLYKNMSEEDVKTQITSEYESNPFLSNKEFKMSDLLDRSLYANVTDYRLDLMLANVRRGVNVEDFWVLYFIDKFTLTTLNNDGTDNLQLNLAVKNKILELYNKTYNLNGVNLTKVEDLSLLATLTASETNIKEKRLFSYKQLMVTPNGGLMSTDEHIFINKNDSVYIKLLTFNSSSNQAVTLNDDNTETVKFARYATDNQSELTSYEYGRLRYIRNILGNSFYQKGTTIYSPMISTYASLPEGEVPLESMPNGTKFNMVTSSGKSEDFILINNALILEDGSITAKIAKVKGRDAETLNTKGVNSAEKAYSYYRDLTNYATSIKGLGQFNVTVYPKSSDYAHLLNPSELTSYSLNYNSKTTIYFDLDNKSIGNTYYIPTNVRNNINEMILLPSTARNINTNKSATNSELASSKLMVPQGLQTGNYKYSDLVKNNFKPSGTETGNTLTPKVFVYESFLINYGTISLSLSNTASINRRSDYILNKSPVMTDLVNELVKALDIERANVEIKTLGKLSNGDKVVFKSSNGGIPDLTLVRTSASALNGYVPFISAQPSRLKISANDLGYSSSLVLKNYSEVDSIRVYANGERRTLYSFIGNKNLGIASSNTILSQKAKLDLSKVSSTKFLTEDASSNKYVPKILDINSKLVSSVDSNDKFNDYNYFLELYLDPNLTVVKDKNGFYVVDGYAKNNLINVKEFTSRTDTFKGVFNPLLSVLPAYSSVDGKFLGLDLSSLDISKFSRIFSVKFWDDLVTNAIYDAEKLIAGFGIYYVYILLVMVILAKALPGSWFDWLFNPVKFMTFGKVEVDNVQLRKFIPQAMFIVALLALVYNGFIRVLLLKAEEIRVVISDYIFILF